MSATEKTSTFCGDSTAHCPKQGRRTVATACRIVLGITLCVSATILIMGFLEVARLAAVFARLAPSSMSSEPETESTGTSAPTRATDGGVTAADREVQDLIAADVIAKVSPPGQPPCVWVTDRFLSLDDVVQREVLFAVQESRTGGGQRHVEICQASGRRIGGFDGEGTPHLDAGDSSFTSRSRSARGANRSAADSR